MIYLDYSATTKTSDEVLDTFVKVSHDFPYNSNSLHLLGVKAHELENSSTRQIASYLNIKESEIIYTSGSSESNNTAIKGICNFYKTRGKHILTTNLEHSSIYGPLGYLQKNGFEVEMIDTDSNGVVIIDDLIKKLRKDTILVSICSVNSETGVLQPINLIGKTIHENSNSFFHVDMTQSIGKVKIPFDNVDLASISAHKIYGIKGIGMLYKRENINIEPLIHGGKSTTKYRSGTPAIPLIASFAKAIRLCFDDIDSRYDYILKLNKKIKESLKDLPNVVINSNDKCIPHILNISVLNVKPETMLHALESEDIYISTQSACSSNDISKAVFEVTKSELKARHSIRISLSYLTTEDEVDTFIEKFKAIVERLGNIR